MDKTYWLDRERSSVAMANRASSAEARLIHYHMAGIYSVKAARAASSSTLGQRLWLSRQLASRPRAAPELGDGSDELYYLCLERGAMHLADTATLPSERSEHLEMARIYRARAAEAAKSEAVHAVH